MPDQSLHLTLIQTALFWEDAPANRELFGRHLSQIPPRSTDLIVLPEMFTTGFTMNAAACAEPMEGETLAWMREQAALSEAALLGSVIIADGGHYYNRALFVTPDGQVRHYDKRHLFRMAGEDEHYSAGEARCLVEWKSWRLNLLVCYDLRFPVWSRNLDLGYDALLCIANWPAPRISAWDALLRARAIENLCYAIGVNRVGNDGKDVPYNGHSGVYDFKGDSLLFAAKQSGCHQIVLRHEDLSHYREKFPAHLDADRFRIL